MKESSTCKKRVRHSLCVPVACGDAAAAAAAAAAIKVQSGETSWRRWQGLGDLRFEGKLPILILFFYIGRISRTPGGFCRLLVSFSGTASPVSEIPPGLPLPPFSKCHQIEI